MLFVLALLWWHYESDPRDWLVPDDRFSAEITAAASRYDLDPQLVRAVVFQESRFDPYARGGKGEVGLMQVLPRGAVADWAEYHKKERPGISELMSPELNLEIGCWYLSRAKKRWQKYRCSDELALCQYNAGERRAKNWCPQNPDGEVISRITISSTRNYVREIMRRYRRYLLQ